MNLNRNFKFLCSVIGLSFLGTSAFAQSIGDTRNEAPSTHRESVAFHAVEGPFSPGSHDWSRDEYLYNTCTGEATNNSHWTSPFSTIKNDLWEHYEKSGTLSVPQGYQGYIDDYRTYTVYGTSEQDKTVSAIEYLGGERYELRWNGVNFSVGWYTFAWTRNEKTWSYRDTTTRVTTPDPEGEGGAGN